MARQLMDEQEYLLSENKKDLANGHDNGLSESLLDRLTLSAARIANMAEGLQQVANLPDPIGAVTETLERPNGLQIEKVRVPLGVIGMIYEARPNVTVDASSLCLKTGNAVLLRGSSSAIHSNKALVSVLHRALAKTALPYEAIQLIEDTSREVAAEMFTLNEYLDVLIPRGGASLIQAVVKNASVPVLETGVGNCHVYIDQSAKEDMAISIAINAKTQRPSVCNACETLLLHKEWADNHLDKLMNTLQEQGVSLFGDNDLVEQYPNVKLANEADWAEEYLDLKLAIKMVSSTDEAIAHIQRYGTKHSEAIISEDETNVASFLNRSMQLLFIIMLRLDLRTALNSDSVPKSGLAHKSSTPVPNGTRRSHFQ